VLAARGRLRGGRGQETGFGSAAEPPGWPGEGAIGGDYPPRAIIADPYPTFDGMAVDPENGVVVMSDENRHSLLIYDRQSGPSTARGITEPKRHVFGTKIGIGFAAGVALDPKRREAWVVNNDGGGIRIFSYDQHGNVAPIRSLTVPHQSWGLSIDATRGEIAVTSQQYQAISFFKTNDTGAARPVRTIRGLNTRIADPHGVYFDGPGNEVLIANHGNWTEMRSYAAGIQLATNEYHKGLFESPSIRIYAADANGNVPPIREIQGSRTRLDWPMGLDVQGNDVAVANYGTNSVLIFSKKASGDVAPSRTIGGPRTGIVGPVDVAFRREERRDLGGQLRRPHRVVFDITAAGDVAPKRIIRNAPAGTPTTGFTNAAVVAYDSKRQQLLVPN